MAKGRTIIKEGRKGKIVSREYAEANPGTTMEITVSNEKKHIEQLKNLLDVQKATVITMAHNDYQKGLYNGLELALATLEEREPDYL
jgi:hypothetical protein